MKTKGFFMNIKDKKKISEKRCFPTHYFPHKFSTGEKISNEKCHLHKEKWRMTHHKYFCKKLKCPHYDFVIKESIKNERNI